MLFRSKVIKNFVQAPYSIIDASNISPVARLLWIYIESNADNYFPDRKVIAEHLGVSLNTVTTAKKQLLEHNMIFLEEVETKYKKIKHYLYAQDPSCWSGVIFKNNRSNKAGANFTPATKEAGSKIDPAAGSKIDPNKIKRNIKKREIDKASSIYQDDIPKNKSKLADHEFVKELKSNRQNKDARLQKLRDDIHALEKKMAAHEQGAVPREVFIEYLPKKVSIEPTLRKQISEGLSGFGLSGDSTDWRRALHMAYRLQAGLGLEGYKRIVKKLRQIKQGDITAQDFANLRADGFEEKYGKPLYEFLIMG